ncbi:MAG TPA: hypothetical protein VFH71_12270 [Rhodanobacteraceae bacterium]|nr:hypothetical protein [Rhodanobacteraceae bacterium]
MMTHTQTQISFRDALSDAVHYWELRRIVYNLALLAVVVALAIVFWSRIETRLSFELLLGLVVLAVLANVCYCAAYVVDLPMQLSSHVGTWKRWRWLLCAFGVLFGMALAWYWAGDEILPALLMGK